jgi:hypothetical protein
MIGWLERYKQNDWLARWFKLSLTDIGLMERYKQNDWLVGEVQTKWLADCMEMVGTKSIQSGQLILQYYVIICHKPEELKIIVKLGNARESTGKKTDWKQQRNWDGVYNSLPKNS